MKVSIVIPCLNEIGYIQRCLNSLVALDYDKSLLNVYVCDGLSSDGTAELIKDYASRYPFIHYLENTARTTPQALNLGLRIPGYDFAIILGAHAEMHPDYINACIRAFAIDPHIGCAGGVIENVHENEISEAIGKAMSSVFGVGNAHFRTNTASGYVDTVAFGAYRREVFEKCGYFDESLVRNQDDEFNYRILQSDFKIWLSPEIKCRYYVRASFAKLNRQYYQYGYWKVFVNKKHRAVTTLRQLVPAVWVAFLFSGFIPALFYRPLIFLYIAGILLYLAASVYAALRLSRQPAGILRIIRAFWILHFAYGRGYLTGIFDFLLLNRNPAAKNQKLSR